MYAVSWYVLYLFLTQYGIYWAHYFKIQKRARILNVQFKYEQQGLRALLFYDPQPLLRLRHELVMGLRRMQPFMNFVIYQCLTEHWSLGYRTSLYNERMEYDDSVVVLNAFTSRLLFPWLDLAMRVVNIPWTTAQLKNLILFEPSVEGDVSEHTPCMYLKASQDGPNAMPQFFREWQVKSKIKRSELLDERVRYSLGETISFYMWFFWEYGYLAHKRVYREYVPTGTPHRFELRTLRQPNYDKEYPTFMSETRGKRLSSNLRRFIEEHMRVSRESLRYMQQKGQGSSFVLLLQYVAMAGHFWRIEPDSTKMHAWTEMNDLTLSLDDKQHRFWQIHYQQMRGFNAVKEALHIQDQFRLGWTDEEKRNFWAELSPIPRELRRLVIPEMLQFTRFM
jgi:hypothetical protein